MATSSQDQCESNFNEHRGPRKRLRSDSPDLNGNRHKLRNPECSSVQEQTPPAESLSQAEDAAIPSTIAQAQDKASLASRTSFATLGVAPWLVASLSAMQIKRPTIIQAGCIPEIIKGRDCIGGSRTGSGKTIAFAVPILHQWARDPTGIYAVILTPTR